MRWRRGYERSGIFLDKCEKRNAKSEKRKAKTTQTHVSLSNRQPLSHLFISLFAFLFSHF